MNFPGTTTVSVTAKTNTAHNFLRLTGILKRKMPVWRGHLSASLY
jgi:hypothetical protein